MKLSVIIPAYNEEQYLPETLECVRKALSLAGCASEIIVVNNDSQDGTQRVAEAFGATVVLEAKHNISKVRNIGGGYATGDVLIFVDADTLVPETLFNQISSAMHDDKCFGGAVAVEWGQLKRKWMRLYLLGGFFWTKVLDMKQGAAQFCRRSAFEQLQGYDETIFMGEDVEFYWRLSNLAKQNNGHMFFIKQPKVISSARRFDQMSLWKTFVLTNPLFIPFMWRKKSHWKDWYEDVVR